MVGVVFPPCYLTWGQMMVGVLKINLTSCKRSHAALLQIVSPTLQQATADPCLCRRLPDTHRQVWVSFCGVTAPFSWVLGHTSFCLCPQRVCFQSCVSSGVSGTVNGDLLQEGLCHNQVYWTQSLCPCSRLLLTHTSAGDTQHSSVSVFVVSLGPGAHKVCLSPLRVSGGYGV